jgi:Uma2 family endonuclease
MSAAVLTSAARKTKPPQQCGVSIHFQDVDVSIPPGIMDHEAFRKWARSPECPQRGRFAFFHNQIWADVSMEQAYTHNVVKSEFAVVLTPMCRSQKVGRYFTDGMLLTNERLGFTTVPDGIFITFDALESGLVREVAGKQGGCVEFAGAPKMVLEIVSESSENKDRQFVKLYYQAGIEEYWLVDVRFEAIRFEIYKRGARRFVATRPQSDGWLKSQVFGRFFRLLRSTDVRGNPDFTLELKESLV